MPCVPGEQQTFRRAQVRQRRAAPLSHQVQRQYIGAQAKEFADIAGQTRAKIAGAGADNHGINLPGRGLGLPQSVTGGLRGEHRGVPGKSRLQCVRRDLEGLLQRIKGQMAGGDSIPASQYFLQKATGTGQQAPNLGRCFQGQPAFFLCVAVRR